MRVCRFRRAAGVLAMCVAASAASAGQRPGRPVDIGWVGLYSNQLIGWLENENRLAELCPDGLAHAERERCRTEKLAPRQLVVPLRMGPPSSAKSAGSLVLRATPGEGLRVFYVAAAGGMPREFEPDLYLQDWFYGPYFSQTYLDRRGPWFLLPQKPFPAGTWIDAGDLDSEPHTLTVSGIVNSPQGSLVIIAIEPDAITARPEQPADMWCKAGEPPSLEPWTSVRIPIRDLYSPTGHLLISPKYMKGC